MNTKELPLLLNRTAVATLLSLCTKSVDLLIADGRLTATRIGGRVLVHRSEVERFALAGTEGRIRA
jgi:excisionase family DNA binding protein